MNAAGAELSGMAAFDSRVFFYSPAFSGQQKDTYYPSFMLQPELRHALNGDRDRLSLIPFVRVDPEDGSRNHWDIREMKWLHVGDGWDMSLGVGKVFWGVTESRHLVDIINQTDLVEDIDQEEKLGQPMANVNLVSDYGTFSVYAMPRFRERTFENFRNRLRFELPIDDRHPHYESSLGVWHPDFAVRWSHTLGEWDIGIAQFWGTGREPTFDLSLDDPYAPRLIPRYDIINQTSVDLQFTHDAWLWKLEALTRGGQGRRFAAVTAGVEYTFSNAFDSGVDLGLLTEYSYDGRDRNPTVAPPTPFDNDVFFGLRLGFNDEQDTQLLAGSVQDLGTGAKFVNLEASRRVGEAWKVELKARFFMDAPQKDFVLYGFRRDDYVQLRIARYF
ncbi:hypothetical protein ACWJKU_16810 [Methylocaldum sp. MU1018]